MTDDTDYGFDIGGYEYSWTCPNCGSMMNGDGMSKVPGEGYDYDDADYHVENPNPISDGDELECIFCHTTVTIDVSIDDTH